MTNDKETRMRDFAKRMQKAMVAKGWSQSDLARAAQKFMPEGQDFGRHLINYYIRLRGLPTPIYLKALADALGVPPDELLPPQDHWTTREFVGVQIASVEGSPDEVWLEYRGRMSMTKAIEVMKLVNDAQP